MYLLWQKRKAKDKGGGDQPKTLPTPPPEPLDSAEPPEETDE